MIPVHVQLQSVLDLRDPATIRALQLTANELRLNFRLRTTPTPTQSSGEACTKGGVIDGIAYESLTPAGRALPGDF